MKDETRVNHPRVVELPSGNRSLSSPVYHSVKYTCDSLSQTMGLYHGRKTGFLYSRMANPTVSELELLLCDLQGVEAGIAVASGAAAISATLLSLLSRGDHLIAFVDSYVTTRNFLMNSLSRFGIETIFLSIEDKQSLEVAARDPRAKAILFESPTNPLLKVADIEHFVHLAKSNSLITILDNTFAGFHNHGTYDIDYYIHSLTKFAIGHGDAMGGVILSSKENIDAMRATVGSFGAVMDPQAAFLALRGMKTYFLRYRAQCQSALAIAGWLETHPDVRRIYYPGLASHPQYALAKKQMRDGGAVIAFDLVSPGLNQSNPIVTRFIESLRVFQLACSLGSTESLVAPGEAFFCPGLTKSQVSQSGISPTTIRLSVGVEACEDLIEDLDQAIQSISSSSSDRSEGEYIMKTKEQWNQLAAEISLPGKSFINGKAVGAKSGECFSKINPATGEEIAQIAACSETEVDEAVRSARLSFEDRRWRDKAPAERKRILLRFAELIRQNKNRLAVLETLDVGKPITDSLNVDVAYGADYLSWYAEAIDKIYDEVAPVGPNALATITREPIGVVGAVTPWNFPLILAAWKIGPALAMGNSVVLKPAEQASMTSIELGELAMEAGLPAGVLNVVTGLGEHAGKAIGLHPDVDLVTFTGSTEVGKLFQLYSGQSNLKRVALECGGKSPQIVTQDYDDLDKVASAIAWGFLYNQGEVCHAGSRLIVDRKIEQRLLEKVAQVAQEIQPGDPLDPATKMGALIDQSQLDRVLGYIESGKAEGASLYCGGKRVRQESGGYFVEPTIFVGANAQMKIAREEIFGPVLTVISFDRLEEAISIANDSDFGLAASIWCSDVKVAHRASRELRAGSVWINTYDQSTPQVPFGGYKQSGIGRDRSLHSLDKFCEIKTTWCDLSE